MEIKLNDAKKAAKELNDFLGLAPAIDVKAPIDVLLEKIGLAVELLEDGELEELTEVTQQVVTAIQNQEDEEEGTEPAEEKPVAKKETKKPTKKEEVAEENPIELIKEQMEEATLEELKDLVKANKEMFPTAAKGISLQNNEEKLRAKMEADLAGDMVQPTKPTVEKEEVKKPEEKVKSPAKKEVGGMEGLAIKLLSEKASEKEITKAFTEAYKAKGKTDGEFIKARIAIYMKIAKKRILR